MLIQDIPLKKHCNYKIGGPADYFSEFDSPEALIESLTGYRQIEPEGKIFILGSGTNILFSDAGFRGLVLKDNIKFINRIENIDGKIALEVGSGVLVDEFVAYCTSNSLSGFEWAGGLPGTIGGAIRGNAGAFNGETKDNIYSVASVNLDSFNTIIRTNKECEFDYRMSIFKKGFGKDEVILSAIFLFSKKDQEEIKNETQSHIDYRIDRHPLDLPSIGSTFKNVPVEEVPEQVLKEFEKNIKHDPFPVLPVAKLLLGADLIGKRIGDAQISTKHPNFIVNLGNAKANDVLELIDMVKKTIQEKYAISLEEEIMVVPS